MDGNEVNWQDTHVLIATPTAGYIQPETVASTIGMIQANARFREEYRLGLHWSYLSGYDVASARNKLVRKAQDHLQGITHILFVDDDVTFRPEYVRKMVEDDCDVVLGWDLHRYRENGGDGKTNICRLGEYDFRDQIKAEELKDPARLADPVFQVHGGGLGFALISMDVFDVLSEQWFRWADHERGTLSEDLWFAHRCALEGIEMYTDARIKCGHTMRYVKEP